MIRTRLDGAQKIFVMENEVRLQALYELEPSALTMSRRKRFTSLCPAEDEKMIALLNEFRTNPENLPYYLMWVVIGRALTAVRAQKVYGGGLKIKRPNKRAA